MRRLRWAREAPTWLLIALIYGGWLALTWGWATVPTWVLVTAGGWLVAWHGSLQHEAIHGHPTPSPAVNALLAGVPLGLWLPYTVYRDSHLRHHAADLTDPIDDPESFYLAPEAWAAAGWPRRALAWAHQTLLGRLVLGPPVAVARFLAAEARQVVRGEHLDAWAAHAAGLGLVVAWLVLICELPLWLYVLGFAYPGLALTLARSFAEHRPDRDPRRRTVVVEAGLPFGLLFLFNNLHVVHHEEPGLPWYAIPRRYRADRDAWLARSGGVLRGYREVARRWLLRPKDAPVHPLAGPATAVAPAAEVA